VIKFLLMHMQLL